MMDRMGFDAQLKLFLVDLQTTLHEAAPAPCLYLREQIRMVSSLRYRDRLFSDLRDLTHPLRPHARVLDLGTGPGLAAALLASRGFQVEGIDIEAFYENPFHARMAEEQRRIWTTLTRRIPGLHFQHYDGHRIPFDADSFDLILAYGVLEHIPEASLDAVMKSMVHVTRSEGYLAIGYLPRTWAWLEAVLRLLGRWYHRRRWGDREIRRFLETYGYTIRRFKRVIYAPQYPPAFANRWKPLFDLMDGFACIPPFSLLARDLVLLAQHSADAPPLVSPLSCQNL